MSLFGLWAAIRTVKSKIGTWEGFEKFREIDENLTRDEWARAIGEARAALANKAEEITRPLNRRPVGTEITTYSTKRASGYMQSVEIFVRDPDTGLIESRYFNIRGDTLRSRQSIVNQAVSRALEISETDPDSLGGEVMGAVYTGTFQMVPRG